MGILLAFTPFFTFAVIERAMGVTAGLSAGAIISAALLLRDALTPGKHMKVLEIGTFLLFGLLMVLSLLPGTASWSLAEVRLRVDAGLLVIVLASIALRRPFTLQYAHEQVPHELWTSELFVRANYVITAVWAAAFAVLVIADVALAYLPTLPRFFPILVTVLALVAAAKFTDWYPERGRTRHSGQ